MMTKTAYYMQMAQEAAAQITGSKEQWTAFLTTSARLYKYPFAEQLMIYKQRPEATACAEYDLWNDRMNRYVKRGSKGIALLDMRGEQPKLRYVFDVADTGERKNSRPVQLWKMNAEHEQPIIRALDVAFDVPAGAGSLENHIMEAAERLARDYWEETAGRSVTSLQIPIWKDMMNSTSELPLRELPLSASHIPSLPGRWAMQMTILSTRIFWTSLILIRRLPPMCWELRSAKCPARSSGKLNARSEPMKEISRQKGAKTMMELNYTKNGDYLIPDIQLSVQEQKPLGKYGRMRRAFLQENNTLLYNHLILTEKLYPHLWEIQETATARMEQMMADLLKANPAPDKKLNQMAWVQHMNMLKAQAEEVILTELINS